MDWRPLESAPERVRVLVKAGGKVWIAQQARRWVGSGHGPLEWGIEGRGLPFTRKHPPIAWMPLPEINGVDG